MLKDLAGFWCAEGESGENGVEDSHHDSIAEIKIVSSYIKVLVFEVEYMDSNRFCVRERKHRGKVRRAVGPSQMRERVPTLT